MFKGIKIIAILFFSFALLLLAAGCSEKDVDFENIFEDNDDTSGDTFEKYIIVLPEGASSSIREKASALSDKIKEKKDSESELVYDSELITYGDNVCPILIGNGRYTGVYLRGYKFLDFGYKYSSGKLFIGGLNEQTTLSAIDSFDERVISLEGELRLDDNINYCFKGEYEMDYASLNGVELCDYTLVYSSDESGSYVEAMRFQEQLAERTGYLLPIKRDDTLSEGTRAICIGRTSLSDLDTIVCPENEYHLIEYPKGVSVVAANDYGTRKGMEKLLERLLESVDNRRAEAVVIGNMRFSFAVYSIEITNMYVYEASLGLEDVVLISESVSSEEIDLLRIYGISESSVRELEKNVPQKYELYFACAGESTACYIYDSEKYELSESFNKRFAGGVLRALRCTEKSTGSSIYLLEILSEDIRNEEYAKSAAQAADGYLFGKEDSSFLITSSFEGEADAAFSDGLWRIARMSALCAEDEDDADPHSYVFATSLRSASTSKSLSDFGCSYEISIKIYKDQI